MTEAEKRLEIARLLTFVYHEWGKQVTKTDVDYWLAQLKGVSKKLAWQAAQELIRRKTYGIPKFQDYWTVLLELAPRQRGTYNGRIETAEQIILGGKILPALQKGEQLLLGEK